MKTAILGSKGTTLDLMHRLDAVHGIRPELVISLPAALAEKAGVAFYMGPEIAAHCRAVGTAHHEVAAYNLKDPADQAFFEDAGIDLLIVEGWERLLPDAVLATLGRFACGMHGSAFGLPRGRGRSPMNWALLTGQTRFETSLFRYDAGTDSGDIIGTREYEITAHDTISTLHAKNRIVMADLVASHYGEIEAGTVAFTPQPAGTPTYYPRRRPEDGVIDFSKTTAEIHNLIRAVAPPYPGAFCFLGGHKVMIDVARPFDRALFGDAATPGTILDVSPSADRFVMATADGSLEAVVFEGVPLRELKPGVVLEGGDQDAVLADIRTRYPDDIPPEQREI